MVKLYIIPCVSRFIYSPPHSLGLIILSLKTPSHLFCGVRMFLLHWCVCTFNVMEAREQPWVLFLLRQCPFVWGRDSHWPGACQINRHCVLHLPTSGVTDNYTLLPHGLGFWNQSSLLHSRQFPSWVNPPASTLYMCECVFMYTVWVSEKNPGGQVLPTALFETGSVFADVHTRPPWPATLTGSFCLHFLLLRRTLGLQTCAPTLG